MEISEITSELVRWSMNLAQAQAEIAGRNIAFANTEGYLPQRVDFSSQLAALDRANGNEAALARQLSRPEFATFTIVTENAAALLGNGVQLDHEVSQLTFANTRYMSLVDSLNRHFGLMRLAVTGRT